MKRKFHILHHTHYIAKDGANPYHVVQFVSTSDEEGYAVISIPGEWEDAVVVHSTPSLSKEDGDNLAQQMILDIYC